MLHAKTLTVDGAWSAVGSANFDNRSFQLNDEATLCVTSDAFAERADRAVRARPRRLRAHRARALDAARAAAARGRVGAQARPARAVSEGARLGVDVGGTFTDLVALVDGALLTAKVPSTPRDQSEGVLASAARGVDVGDVAAFAHGMTVATNALLERRGARTALVTTAGFRDVLEIGRQDRPDLYDLARDRPPALIPRELRFCVRERMGPEGELEPLDEDERRGGRRRRCARPDVEAVAVCLLFAFLHPEHEERVGAAIRDGAARRARVAVERGAAGAARVRALRDDRGRRLPRAPARRVPAQPRRGRRGGRRARRRAIMQSSGGVVDLAAAAAVASGCVLSGPAGGVVGASFAGAASGYEDLLTFDMGGTSTDVAPVVGGEVQTTTDAVVAGVPIRHPMVDVHTVSAGGGSIARADAGGALHVGPHSAGAEPGPACYERGGEEPTVTDANLFLGLLADGAELGGGEVRPAPCGGRAGARTRGRAARARRAGDGARASCASPTPRWCARCASSASSAAWTRATSRSPRSAAPGGMHACALAEELGIATVLVPRASGVLSALGLAISDLRRDFVAAADRGARRPRAGRDRAGVRRAGGGRARRRSTGAELSRRADLRYRRQAFELTVDADDLDALAERFHAAHEQRYGYAMREEPVELVAAAARRGAARWRSPSCASRRRPRATPEPRRARGLRRRRVGRGRRARPRADGRGQQRRGPGDRRVQRGDVLRAAGLARRGSTGPGRWC